MSPRKQLETGTSPAPTHLRFTGRSDYFVAGVPQSNLKVVDEPQAADEVSAGKAAELVATSLYEAMSAEAYDAGASKAASAEEAAAAKQEGE